MSARQIPFVDIQHFFIFAARIFFLASAPPGEQPTSQQIQGQNQLRRSGENVPESADASQVAQVNVKAAKPIVHSSDDGSNGDDIGGVEKRNASPAEQKPLDLPFDPKRHGNQDNA